MANEQLQQRSTTLPEDSAERKRRPLFSGVLRYFPAALAEVARVSQIGNDKHNPGQEMHHARAKSTDHADCIMRHLIDMGDRGGLDENGVPQVAYVAWRALALCQEWLEKNAGAPLAPGARVENVFSPLLKSQPVHLNISGYSLSLEDDSDPQL